MANNLNYVKRNNNGKLTTNDLVKLGLYTILLILLMAVGVGACAAFFSVVFSGKVYFSVYTTVGTSLFASLAFTLIFNKINKNYAVMIVSVIVGLFLLLSGHVALAFPLSVVCGVISEYFFRKNNEYLSYIFFNLGGLGSLIPMYFMKDNYIEHLKAKDYSQEKIDFIMTNSSINTFFIVVVLTILFSLIGTYIGRKVYFKNFNKAGL